MNAIEICKALSNTTRLSIMLWLKDPDRHFPTQGAHLEDGCEFPGGVCVGTICRKTGLSQSTISHYIGILQNADLVETMRSGKWTYCRRKEETIRHFLEFMEEKL